MHILFQPALARNNKILKNRRNAEDLTNEEEGGSLRNGGKGERKGKRGNKRGKKAGMKRQGGNAAVEQGDAEEEEGEDAQRRLQSEDEARTEVDRLRQEMRARKEEEMRDRYRNSRSRGRDEIDGSMDPDHFMGGGRHRLPGESVEDYMAAQHQEMRDRHRRDRGTGRDRTIGRHDRKRPEHEARHAVLRRRIEKHANLFTPEELAEIDDELKEHKIREDKIDAARDKLNAQFDALRNIDDRDERLDKLEELKELRASGRDADRMERDKLREEFQLIRERLEAKLRSEL